MLYPFENHLGFNHIHAGKVATAAGTVTIDAAGATREIDLNGVLHRLFPAHESCQRMGGSPDADHGSGCERSQVHVGGVHGEHHVQMAHEDQFLVHVLHVLADV